jgi:hypothetical protein
MSAPLSQRLGYNGYAVARNLDSKLVPVSTLKPLGRETRKHAPAQVRKLAESLDRFGFVLPILVDGDSRVVAGWGLVLAARKLGVTDVPAVIVSDLSDADLRLLRLALNRLGEDSNWDVDALKLEFGEVLEISNNIDLRISGFEMGEIDVVVGGAIDEEDALPIVNEVDPPVTRFGDLWRLGDHGLLCADALMAESYERIMGEERAQMIFTDPPWNIAIEDNVSGLGAVKHKDFAMACGEMTPAEFEAFLKASLGHAAAHSEDGALHYVCMHWSKMKEVLAAADGVYDDLVNLCIWNKTNAGMGSLYRSKHELVFVFKNGSCPHINNVGLGRHGRHRANVWDYPGQNAMDRSSKSKDCSNRSGIVLDPFGGIGTTLIAAEKAGRKARLIEIDPCYVDTTIMRWQRLTGRTALRADTQRSFQELLEAARLPEPAPDPASR